MLLILIPSHGVNAAFVNLHALQLGRVGWWFALHSSISHVLECLCPPSWVFHPEIHIALLMSKLVLQIMLNMHQHLHKQGH